MQKEPNRGNLYQAYLAALMRKKAAYAELDEMKTKEGQRRSELKEKWNERRKEIQRNMKITSKDRWNLLQQAYLLQKNEMAQACAGRKAKHQKDCF